MSTASPLAQYQQLLNHDIIQYCGKLLQDTKTVYGLYSHDALTAYCAILQRGGKRLRGALVMNAYAMLGGTDQALALHAARVIEMFQAYILIMDDICDNSAVRRGGPAAHIALAGRHQAEGWHGDSGHFGVAASLTAALGGLHLAMGEAGKLVVSAEVKVAALNLLNQHFVTMVHGQLNDIFDQAVQGVDEAQVERTMLWKTAHYSFASPLQFGAMLAGVQQDEMSYFEDYAMHLGLSFQITDDILGTFGHQSETGKSAQDDLQEGKITLLVARALQKANPQQKQQLLAALGKTDLTPAEYEACRQIIQDTGALDYARQRAAAHAEKAVLALENLPASWGAEQIVFLRELASSMSRRSR